MIEVKKVKRKGEVGYVFSLVIARKGFTCDHVYSSEVAAEKAASNFVKRYINQ